MPFRQFSGKSSERIKKNGNQMQNPCCRNVRNVKFPKIVAEKFAFYSEMAYEDNERNNPARPVCNKQICGGSVYAAVQQLEINAFCTLDVLTRC